jgi:hypothetical protein
MCFDMAGPHQESGHLHNLCSPPSCLLYTWTQGMLAVLPQVVGEGFHPKAGMPHAEVRLQGLSPSQFACSEPVRFGSESHCTLLAVPSAPAGL